MNGRMKRIMAWVLVAVLVLSMLASMVVPFLNG